MNNNERYYNNHTFKLSIICRKCKIRFVNPLLLPTDAHNVKKRRVIKTFRPMTTTHFLSWRPYHVTLCNLLNTVYLHTVHDTHALQGKSEFIRHLSNLFLLVWIFIHILHTYLLLQSQYQAIALTTPGTSFTQILLTKRAIFSQALTLAPWRWFLCKPKHVGGFLSNLECFNNSAFLRLCASVGNKRGFSIVDARCNHEVWTYRSTYECLGGGTSCS